MILSDIYFTRRYVFLFIHFLADEFIPTDSEAIELGLDMMQDVQGQSHVVGNQVEEQEGRFSS